MTADWAMVLVTIVYVIATIVMAIMNIVTVRNTERQFNKIRKLEVRPYLNV